ncbi:MAG TPA: hypothetical protein DCZ95_00085 [Verrucomicrobia bacterium]|nr:MAG: hypothetical protein A2X46_13715 [Lentisphaerae bacterium GWF2_57_35]HBA82468.1 hypothetical protein [Verrucomicrobiota bacterium]
MKKGPRPFTSHVKMMMLTLTLPQSGRWFYQREIQTITGIAYTPVRASLLDLESFGLLKKRTHGNRQYFMIDKDFFLYDEYKRIVLKTTGLGDHLRFVRQDPKDIVAAFVYGDFAEGTETVETPIRFCVVGSLRDAQIQKSLSAAARLTQKKFEYVRFDAPASASRRPAALQRLLQAPAIYVVGKPSDLT